MDVFKVITEECGFFFVVIDDCARGFEWWCVIVFWISIYVLYFLPEGSWIGVLIEFSVECVPGLLFVKSKLCFDSALESVYFCFGVG